MQQGRIVTGKNLNKKRKTFLIISIFLLVFFICGTITGVVFCYKITSEIVDHRVSVQKHTPEDIGLKSETIQLKTADGIALKAWHIPKKSPKAMVILLHGMDGIDASVMLGHSKFLYEAGYATIALDMRAHGRSEGNTIGLAYKEPLDVSAAIDYVKAREDYKNVPIVLLGVSMGGATAIRTAALRSDIAAVISVSAFSSTQEMMAQYMKTKNLPPIYVKFITPFMMAAFSYKYKVNAWKASPVYDIGKIPPRKMLIAHGTNDKQIDVEQAYKLYEASGKKAELWIEKGAGHCIFKSDARFSDDEFYRKRILKFLSKAIS